METKPEIIYCGRGNRSLDGIAVELGISYGVRLPHSVFFPLDFADQNFKKPDRTAYMCKLEQHRPRWATVIDIEKPTQFYEALSWAEEAAGYVREGLIIIPKLWGVIPSIPETIQGKPVRLGYSVPTKYGSTSVPVSEFAGRPVHLLGGSPVVQYRLSDQMQVASLDCNYISMKAIAAGEYFTGMGTPHWRPLRKDWAPRGTEDSMLLAFALSCMNLLQLWKRPFVDQTQALF